MNDVFYSTFLRNYRTVLPQFQGKFTQANCTLLACAIDNYLSTGAINRVSGFADANGFVQTDGTRLRRATLAQIIDRVRRGGHGTHLVIEAEDSGGRHHFANLLKIGSDVYYVDAFNHNQPVCTTNVTGHLSWASTFHFSIGLRVRMRP